MSRDTMTEIRNQLNLETDGSIIDSEIYKLSEEIKKRDLKRIYIVGCGDSYFAGLAVKNFMSSKLNIACLVMTALEFEAYSVDQVDDGCLVIAISMSGNVTRTISGVKKAQENGAFVIGLTNSTKGKLYNNSTYPIFMDLKENDGWTPGTITYTGTIYNLIKLIISLLDEKSKLDYTNRIKVIFDYIKTNIESIDELAQTVARNLYLSQIEFPGYVLGGGPNYATAKYGAAKFLELCDVLTIGQETEEFAHQEFWIINKNAPVFMISHSGPSNERALEVAGALRLFGNDIISISNDDRFEEVSKYFFRMPVDSTDDYLSPLLYQLPLQLIAYYYSQLKGFDPDNRTHMDPFRKKVSRLLTRGNKNAGY